ncbi:Adenylate cyclase type 10, partial [Tinamus guttatus]
FHGVLLFADVSGFTALTEKFSQSTSLDRGADEVTQTLNRYMGDIVEEILAFGGDILKFAGDAVLVLWRVEQAQLGDTISLVLQCSQRIQQKYGMRRTDVGLQLRLKIGISAGHMSFLTVGDGKELRFLVFGRAVGDVWHAQNAARASDVILSAHGWELCNQSKIRMRMLDGPAVKVTGMEEMSESEYDDILSKVNRGRDPLALPSLGVLRPAVTLPPWNPLRKLLCKYIPATVVRKIDDGQPLECLSELRPVSCLFVQLHFAEDVSLHQLCKGIQDSNVIIATILRPYKGEINKICMFDKGCTLLCVFGLPGNKVPCESVHALGSALAISKACISSSTKLEAVSIGVTTGTVFCGVVGHPMRHEYTVIGQKVNLAARLMEFYPGVVSCDTATYAASRLPRTCFKELPEVAMKGVADPGTIYQYLGISKELMFGMELKKERPEHSPLLGRDKEIALFKRYVQAYVAHGESHVMAFEGMKGSGKSHLLSELAKLGRAAGHRVVAVALTELHMKQDYSVLRGMLAMAMDLQACQSCSTRQLVLQEKLQGLMEESSYCLLNALFLVKFPASKKVLKMNGAQRALEVEIAFKKVLQKTFEDKVLFLIDNAHYMDSFSWAVLSHVLRDIPSFVVMGFAPGPCRGQRLCRAAADVMKLQQTTYIRLEELKPSGVMQKACRHLGVVSMPHDLETFLMQRSGGMPYYCEELLSHLQQHNMLLIQPLRRDEGTEPKWENLFTPATEAPLVGSARRSSAHQDCRVCTIRAGVNLQNMVLPPSLKGIALTELDSMNFSEQMVLKCAAIIGPTFTTELLFHILPKWTRTKLNKILSVLVTCNILRWQNVKTVAEDSSVSTTWSATTQQEETDDKWSLGESDELQSDVLAFRVPLLREAAYELWPRVQRVAMHRKCAAFLERRAHKCQSCGGAEFVAFHHVAVSSSPEEESTDSAAGKGCSASSTGEESRGHELPATAERFLAKTEQTVPRNSKWMHGASCSCECKATADLVLVPLAHHHLAMGNEARAIYYLLESAAAYVHVSNNYLAFTSLQRAEALRSAAAQKGEGLASFEEATLLSLKGEVCYNMGCMELAEKNIRKALSLLKRPFPSTSASVFFKSLLEKSPHASYRKSRESSSPQETGRERLPWLLRQSRCLALLRQLFSQRNTSSRQRLSGLAAGMK